jgi:hypothetical protein
MKRRTIVPLIIIALLVVSLAALAAITTGGPQLQTVTPQVHKSGTEGYFRIVTPLPAGAPQGRLVLPVQAEAGDIFLLNAISTESESSDEDEGDSKTAATPAARTITITGRFSHPGPARLSVMSRSPEGQLKPLLKLALTLPGADVAAPDVRSEWARQQQWSFLASDPEGEDSFSHYWDLAIAPRYGLSSELHESSWRSRREPPDLYSVFTGAAAIQETLQLELLGGGRSSDTKTPDKGVALASLSGPTVKSHPFREMLKGRMPQLPPLATVMPQDQYAVFFSDINKQIELADLMDEWGGNLLHQVESSARDFKVRQKISSQLCLENSQLTRWFGDRVVADMAFTGSDPFLKEGTAFTVLFSLKNEKRFRKQLEKRYAEAVASHGAVSSSFTLEGFQGMTVVSPDRSISSHTLFLDNVAVVSTSREALARIVAVRARRLPALSQADDFRYMRTIFPQNSDEEDIFIYLSDAHIRNLVGPRWKIGEARRMRCAGNMTLLANARLWFRAEHRREPTMAELVAGGYLGKNPPVCPDHGTYEIGKNGAPHCSLHNRPGLLTPVGEVPLERVTSEEAEQYNAFVENYNRYWTRFFDPIGIRIKMGKDIRIQTCILPLIENSWYDGLAAFSGRTPGNLTESVVLPRTVMSLRGHMAPEWLQQTDLVRKLADRNRLNLSWLGDEISLNLCDGQVLFSVSGNSMGLLGHEVGRSSSLEPLVIGYLGSALNLPTYLAVKVTDPKKAEQSIPSLFSAIGPSHSRDDELSVETYSLDNHHGKPLYVANFTLWVVKLRLYSAVVDDRLVIASRRDIVTDLMDASAKGSGAKAVRQEGNMEMSLYRSAFKQLEDVVNLGYQEEVRHACHKNLPLAAILLKNLGISADRFADDTSALRGYTPYCPSGGHYFVDPKNGAVTCSVHGNRYRPRQPESADQSSATLKLVNSLERVNARLSFTPEGLMTTVDIRR